MRKRDTHSGKFVTDKEPVVSKPISIRLPPSLEAELKAVAGDKIASWIREAISEKLERDKQHNSA
jgi:predicted DNA-binding protein